MATAFITLLEDLKDALLQAPAVAGARVYTGRARLLPQDHASSVNITLEGMNGQQAFVGVGPVDWDVTYGIEIRARGSATVSATDALDPIFEAAYARIAGLTARPGVMGWVLQPRVRLDVEEADTPIASLQLALNVRLRTQAGSLALAA